MQNMCVLCLRGSDLLTLKFCDGFGEVRWEGIEDIKEDVNHSLIVGLSKLLLLSVQAG